jgi:monovalent cation:H+ antiporter-2, CPA2 family
MLSTPEIFVRLTAGKETASVPHETSLIATIAVGLALAFIGGFIASRLRLPPLVGYLLAGVAIGPFTPGFVADGELAAQLAEIGVILLMFGVGIHFSFKDLLDVRRIALPGAVVQIAVATLLGVGVTAMWGWSLGAGIVFGLSLSVASTVVLLRALEEREALRSVDGRIAIGWLIVEDLVMVLALVLLPALAGVLGGSTQGLAGSMGGGNLLLTLGFTLGKVAIFVALMIFVGARVIPWLLAQVARTSSRELFTLAVLAVALGIAFGSAELFGVSFALGAFFAGVIVSESDLSHRAAEEALPLQDAFAVLFFVSVGMLFDPSVVVEQPLQVVTTVAIIVFGKSLAAFLIVLLFHYPARTALTVSASLAQIGEFSFILAGLGVALGLLPTEGQSLILAGALLSITLNPLVFRAIDPLTSWLQGAAWFTRAVDHPRDPLTELPSKVLPGSLHGHIVIIGYGRVGRVIGPELERHGVPFLIVEQNREYVEELRQQGLPAIYGDAAVPGVLEYAPLKDARLLAVATPDALLARQIIELARTVNPTIDTVVRTHSEEAKGVLERMHVGMAVLGETELAHAMVRYVQRDAEKREREGVNERE